MDQSYGPNKNKPGRGRGRARRHDGHDDRGADGGWDSYQPPRSSNWQTRPGDYHDSRDDRSSPSCAGGRPGESRRDTPSSRGRSYNTPEAKIVDDNISGGTSSEKKKSKHRRPEMEVYVPRGRRQIGGTSSREPPDEDSPARRDSNDSPRNQEGESTSISRPGSASTSRGRRVRVGAEPYVPRAVRTGAEPYVPRAKRMQYHMSAADNENNENMCKQLLLTQGSDNLENGDVALGATAHVAPSDRDSLFEGSNKDTQEMDIDMNDRKFEDDVSRNEDFVRKSPNPFDRTKVKLDENSETSLQKKRRKSGSTDQCYSTSGAHVEKKQIDDAQDIDGESGHLTCVDNASSLSSDKISETSNDAFCGSSSAHAVTPKSTTKSELKNSEKLVESSDDDVSWEIAPDTLDAQNTESVGTDEIQEKNSANLSRSSIVEGSVSTEQEFIANSQVEKSINDTMSLEEMNLENPSNQVTNVETDSQCISAADSTTVIKIASNVPDLADVIKHDEMLKIASLTDDNQNHPCGVGEEKVQLIDELSCEIKSDKVFSVVKVNNLQECDQILPISITNTCCELETNPETSAEFENGSMEVDTVICKDTPSMASLGSDTPNEMQPMTLTDATFDKTETQDNAKTPTETETDSMETAICKDTPTPGKEISSLTQSVPLADTPNVTETQNIEKVQCSSDDSLATVLDSCLQQESGGTVESVSTGSSAENLVDPDLKADSEVQVPPGGNGGTIFSEGETIVSASIEGDKNLMKPDFKTGWQAPPSGKDDTRNNDGNFAEDVDLSNLDEEDSWDTLFDDSGECLDEHLMDELTQAVGAVKVEKPLQDYSVFSPKDLDEDYEAYTHLVEIYEFPSELLTRDLIAIFRDFTSRGFDIKWVDDTHAIGVFSSTIAANDALSLKHPLMKVRPISEATRQTQLKARKSSEFMLPYKPRPETNASCARRLVTGALGLNTRVSREQREQERKQLKDAREKKRLAAKQTQDAWDGTINKCAMDET